MSQQKERVLITGGASGIGAKITAEAIRRGFEAVVMDRVPSPAGITIIADLSDRSSTARALDSALEGGPITRLVNNVGAVFPNTITDQALDEAESAFALNLRCALQCTQALIPGMKAAHFGRIVNMSSRAALGKELRAAYAATKAGLIGLTRVAALELGVDGITVNAVGPGPIATELFNRANPPGSPRTRAIIEQIPVGRVGQPEDVSNAVWFFLDQNAGFVTGQTLYVCGGLTVGKAPL